MTIEKLVSKLNATPIYLKDKSQIVSKGFCEGLLSEVMTKDLKDAAWFTTLANQNVIAVAEHCGAVVLVLCGRAAAAQEFCELAKRRGVSVVKTDVEVFEAVVKAFGAQG